MKRAVESPISSLLSGANAAYLEEIYESYLRDPGSVSAQWSAYFSRLPPELPRADHKLSRTARSSDPPSSDQEARAKQGAVSRLIQVYANRGHLIADLDPLGMQQRVLPDVLKLEHYGLSDGDLDNEFFTNSRTDSIPARSTLRSILRTLKSIYCGTIGAEFAHVSDSAERIWLQDNYQVQRLRAHFTPEEQRLILRQLSASEGLERYLHSKYVGQKRFSLEGAESLVPLMEYLVQQAGSAGIEEMVIGMAHRGRLNLLVNLLGKSPRDLFSEFEGRYDLKSLHGSGDVKYHKGFSADLKTVRGNVHVALAFNPSHLEIVAPVVEGSVRARQERRGDVRGNRVIPVQIHGDAAFAGQGVVMETFQLSQSRGFYTGGTVHIIVNNQVGFTTSEPREARSTLYCSDVAKIVEAPVFHVNADDPEAVCFIVGFALQYRMKFHKDVVIDLVCYRRLGHNESDEPAATQPLMYHNIRSRPTVRQLYADRLLAQKIIATGDAEKIVGDVRDRLDQGLALASAALGLLGNEFTADWSPHAAADWLDPGNTGVPLSQLQQIGRRISAYPETFKLHPRVAAVMQSRARMIETGTGLDWGCAETLAYASLLEHGFSVRLTGQDSGRGTFFHRHAVLHDQDTGNRYMPLKSFETNAARFTVTDSVLSEEAVVGFEYGFSSTEPNCLTIWEAQFGDFWNGAQVIADQFISSGEAKWGRLSGLTLYLPHGYEGQGAEHSSARLERVLQLCAEYNQQVCVPSTPGQMFHLLRRQMLRALRKPLFIMTPKSLLRHPLSVSSLEELASGRFEPVIDEIDAVKPDAVERVVFCSGKVYFDLLKARRDTQGHQVALVRIEQLYPFPSEEYEAILRKYAQAREILWCQEEPQNQGAWFQIRHRLQGPLEEERELLYAGRAAAAAPATGIMALHEQQQAALVRAAIAGSAPESHPTQSIRPVPRSSAAPEERAAVPPAE